MSEKKFQLLKINDYEIKEIIRNLTLGRIKLAKNKRTNELIALKILDKSQIVKTNRIQHISNELKILPILEHPSIISFLGANHDEKYIYLGFEFLPGGDLFSLLKHQIYLFEFLMVLDMIFL